jgi:hypothetical protein
LGATFYSCRTVDRNALFVFLLPLLGDLPIAETIICSFVFCIAIYILTYILHSIHILPISFHSHPSFKMAKFGIGNASFKKKMASFKKEKEEFAKKKAEEEASKASETVSETIAETAPEVPTDVDEVAEKSIEEVKEVADDAAGDMKWKLFMAALKNKLSCCWGGAEESKATFM